MTRRDALAATLVILIWGSNFLVIHVGLSDLPPFALLFARFVFVVVPAVFFIAKPDIPWWLLTAIGLATSAGQFCLMYLALHLGLPVGLAPLLLQVQVFFSVALAAWALRETPTRGQLAGMAVGATGLVVVGLARAESAGWLPFALIIAAGLSWAVGNVLTRYAARRDATPGGVAPSGLGVVVWSGLAVPLPVGVLAGAMERDEIAAAFAGGLPWVGLAFAAFTAVVSTHIGYGLWNALLARNPASALGPFALGIPVVGLTAAFVGLGEVPSVVEAAGGLVVMAGLVLAMVRWPLPGASAR